MIIPLLYYCWNIIWSILCPHIWDKMISLGIICIYNNMIIRFSKIYG